MSQQEDSISLQCRRMPPALESEVILDLDFVCLWALLSGMRGRLLP